eukprot:gene35098-45433_t
MYGSGQLTVKFLQHLRIHHVQLDVIAFAFAFASFSAARIITAASRLAGSYSGDCDLSATSSPMMQGTLRIIGNNCAAPVLLLVLSRRPSLFHANGNGNASQTALCSSRESTRYVAICYQNISKRADVVAMKQVFDEQEEMYSILARYDNPSLQRGCPHATYCKPRSD